jgi:hypothetical protein
LIFLRLQAGILFFCFAKRKVPKRKGDPACAPPAAVPKVQHPKTGKKELALFGAVRQTVLKQLFCFIRFWMLHFGAKEGWGERIPGQRAAARPVLLSLGSEARMCSLLAITWAHQIKTNKDGPQRGTLNPDPVPPPFWQG